MKKKIKTPKDIRQRKFLLVMPLLVLPFLTMIFWALGGGNANKINAEAAVKSGFNINLPDANLKEDKLMNKMSYYDKAQQDSQKFREMVKNDPNYKIMALTDGDPDVSNREDTFLSIGKRKGLNPAIYGNGEPNDPATDKIYRKLAELDKEMSKPIPRTSEKDDYEEYQSLPEKNIRNVTPNSLDVGRLEAMMNTMNNSTGGDPELSKIDDMLDKILDVQYPERVQDRIKKTSESNRGKVYVVTSQSADNYITRLDTGITKKNTINSFYSLNEGKAGQDFQNAVKAIIHQSQTVVDGSTVEFRLVNEVFINGVNIPKNNLVYGIASLNGERLNIKIGSIRYQNSLFPVALTVYDMDGLNGIHIPGAVTRDVAKQSTDRSLQTIGSSSIDPTWKAQAAGAGIEAAKTLFSKKVKLVRVKVKAGYEVLLKNDSEK